MPLALSIAGSDPTGGAGLQADLRVFQSHGVHGAGVITAITAQDTAQVHQVLPAFPNVVLEQLRRLLKDMQPMAIKIGMLATDDVARAVMLGLDALATDTPIVIDPVLASSDGTPLLERRAWGTLAEICSRAQLVTPNLIEAEQLTGVDAQGRAGAEAAARACLEVLGAEAILLKGGHRDGAPDDLLAQRRAGDIDFAWLDGERIDCGPVHGTGCALSSAITAGLAQGRTLEDSIHAARAFVAEGLRGAFALGSGARMLGIP